MRSRFRPPAFRRVLATVPAVTSFPGTPFPVTLFSTLLFSMTLLLASAPHAQSDVEPPRIDHDQIESAPLGRPLEVRARIMDESGVFDPALLYRVERKGAFLRLPMKPVAGEPDVYAATVPGELVSDDVEYFIEAFDEEGNGPARFGDENVPVLVRVLAIAEAKPNEPAVPEDDGAVGLWIGAGVGGAVLLSAAAAGGVALWWLSRADVPATVDVVIKGPLPVNAGVAP